MLNRILIIVPTITALLLSMGCGDFDVYPTSVAPPPIAKTIEDAALTVDDDGALILTWTTPAAPTDGATLSRYDVRFSLDSEFSWQKASPILDPPAPMNSGEPASYRFRDPAPGATLRMALRLLYSDGAWTPVSNVTVLDIPGYSFMVHGYDVLTGAPAAGTTWNFTQNEKSTSIVSDEEGNVLIESVRRSDGILELLNSSKAPQFFDIEWQSIFTGNRALSLPVIPFSEGTVSPAWTSLTVLLAATTIPSNFQLHRWHSLPVPVTFDSLVNVHGIDYGASTLVTLNRWEDVTGIDLFNVVETFSGEGIHITFHGTDVMGIQIGFVEHEKDDDGFPLAAHAKIVNTFDQISALETVLMHELGHTLGLGHLPRGFLMYGGRPIPDKPTPEEVMAVRVMFALPNGTDLSIYREVSP